MSLADCLPKFYNKEEVIHLNQRIQEAKVEGQTDEQAFRGLIPVLEQELFDSLNSIKDQLGVDRPATLKELSTELKDNAGQINDLNKTLTKELKGFDVEKTAKTDAAKLKQEFVQDLNSGKTVVKALGNLRNKLGKEVGSKDLPNQLSKETKGQLIALQDSRRNIIEKQDALSEDKIVSKVPTEPLADVSEETSTPTPVEEESPVEQLKTGLEFGRFTDRILKNESVSKETKTKLRNISKKAEVISHEEADLLARAYIEANGVEQSFEDLNNLASPVWSSGAGIGVNVAKNLAKEFKNDPVKMAQIFDAVNTGVREAGRAGSRLSDPNVAQLTPEERLFALARDSHNKRTEKLKEQVSEDEIVEDILKGIDLSFSEETIDKSIEQVKSKTKPIGQEEITEGKRLAKEALREFRKLGLSVGPAFLSDDGVKALTKLFKGLALQFKGNIKNMRQAWNDSLGKDAKDAWEHITKTTDVLKETAKVRSQNIKDIVLEHVKNPDFNTIEQKLINEGVNSELATKLSERLRDNIVKELQGRIGEIEKQLEPLGGNANKLAKALIKIAGDGLLHENLVADSVLQSLGLGILSQKDFTNLNNKLDDVQKATSRRQKQRLEKEIVAELAQLQSSPRQQALDFALGLFYTSILSGLGTQKVSLVGAGFGALLEMLTASGQLAIKNPRLVLKAWGKAFTPEGFGSGLQTYREILRTGNTDAIQFLDDAPMRSMGAFQKFMNTKHKNISKGLFKGFWTIPTFMYRNLLAMDALLNSGITESFAYVEATNKILAQHSHLKGTPEFYTELNEMLGETNKELLKNQVQKEIKLGLIPKNESKTRLRELIQDGRHNDIQERALDRALQSILMNNNVSGLIPSGIVSFFSQAQNIKETDHPVFASLKFMMKLLFPIIRVPANAVTRAYQFSPLLMIERGIVDPIFEEFGRPTFDFSKFKVTAPKGKPGLVTGFDIKKKERSTFTIDPQVRKDQIARSVLGTTLSLVAFALFGFGDDDEPFVRITGNGLDDFRLNKPTFGEDFESKRIQFKTRKDGKYSEGFKWEDTPLSWAFAPMGQITDSKLQGKNIDYSFLTMVENSVKGVMDGSYDLSLIFLGDFIEGVEAGIKNPKSGFNYITNKPIGSYDEYKVYKELNRKITPFIIPRTYRDLGNIYRDLADKPIPQTNKASDFLLKDLGILESFQNSEPVTDKFGNPIYQDFDFPVTPAALEDVIDDLWNNDNPRFPEYEVLKGKSFVFPRDYNGSRIEGITNEDKLLFKQVYKQNYKKEFNKQSSQIKKLDKEELNKFLELIHDRAREMTQDQILGTGKGTLSKKYKSLQNSR